MVWEGGGSGDHAEYGSTLLGVRLLLSIPSRIEKLLLLDRGEADLRKAHELQTQECFELLEASFSADGWAVRRRRTGSVCSTWPTIFRLSTLQLSSTSLRKTTLTSRRHIRPNAAQGI